MEFLLLGWIIWVDIFTVQVFLIKEYGLIFGGVYIWGKKCRQKWSYFFFCRKTGGLNAKETVYWFYSKLLEVEITYIRNTSFVNDGWQKPPTI